MKKFGHAKIFFRHAKPFFRHAISVFRHAENFHSNLNKNEKILIFNTFYFLIQLVEKNPEISFKMMSLNFCWGTYIEDFNLNP
jgi:hypothetical protein